MTDVHWFVRDKDLLPLSADDLDPSYRCRGRGLGKETGVQEAVIRARGDDYNARMIAQQHSPVGPPTWVGEATARFLRSTATSHRMLLDGSLVCAAQSRNVGFGGIGLQIRLARCHPHCGMSRLNSLKLPNLLDQIGAVRLCKQKPVLTVLNELGDAANTRRNNRGPATERLHNDTTEWLVPL
jgi:hypothetical protein